MLLAGKRHFTSRALAGFRRNCGPEADGRREGNTGGVGRGGARGGRNPRRPVRSIAVQVSLVRHRATSSRFIKPRPLSDFAPCRPARYYSPASCPIPPPGRHSHLRPTFHPPCYTLRSKTPPSLLFLLYLRALPPKSPPTPFPSSRRFVNFLRFPQSLQIYSPHTIQQFSFTIIPSIHRSVTFCFSFVYVY